MDKARNRIQSELPADGAVKARHGAKAERRRRQGQRVPAAEAQAQAIRLPPAPGQPTSRSVRRTSRS
jgi:hypothetical protein